MLFDPEESIDFQGNTGPFIQYTYARILSLIKRGDSLNLDYKNIDLIKEFSIDKYSKENNKSCVSSFLIPLNYLQICILLLLLRSMFMTYVNYTIIFIKRIKYLMVKKNVTTLFKIKLSYMVSKNY